MALLFGRTLLTVCLTDLFEYSQAVVCQLVDYFLKAAQVNYLLDVCSVSRWFLSELFKSIRG